MGCLDITVIKRSIHSRCLHKYVSQRQQLPHIWWLLHQGFVVRNPWLNLFYFLSLSLLRRYNSYPKYYTIIYLNRSKTSFLNNNHVLCTWSTCSFVHPWLHARTADRFCEAFSKKDIKDYYSFFFVILKNVTELFCAHSGCFKTIRGQFERKEVFELTFQKDNCNSVATENWLPKWYKSYQIFVTLMCSRTLNEAILLHFCKHVTLFLNCATGQLRGQQPWKQTVRPDLPLREPWPMRGAQVTTDSTS